MARRTYVSKKAAQFSESVIREMTRLAQRHQAVNLAQGFPDYPAPAVLKEAAKRAIDADKNQYAITWGAKAFRDALTKKHERFSGVAIDPERELTVCCGSTEAMISALLATVDPGEEVIIFEPWYENYGPDAILSGAEPVYVKLRPVACGSGIEWRYDSAELRAAFSARTKGIIVNTPHNPTGKVFSRSELLEIGALCQEFDALLFTDEIYEHILYDGRRHVYAMTLPGLRERTIMISGLSKTFSVTGWRIGYAIAAPEISAAIRKVHDFLTVGAPAPLQEGAVAALELGQDYYDELAREYQRRRDLFLPLITRAGFVPSVPGGAYYVMAEYPDVGISDDVEFTRFLIEEVGVAVVPASSFYRRGDVEAKRRIRFCYPKRDETLLEAGKRLAQLSRIDRGLMRAPGAVLYKFCQHAPAGQGFRAMRLSGLTVLVVEDDVDNLELLASHVEGEGAHTLSAGSIAAALAMTAEQRVDVALCDLELADGDACDLVRRLRAREGWDRLPAIALTGYSDAKWRQKAAECGFDRYAVKPYSLELITEWLLELRSPRS